MLDTKIINLNSWVDAAKVPYFQVYRRQKGETKKPLAPSIKTKLFNVLWREVKIIANDLGFEINFTRKEVHSDPEE